MIGYTDFTFHTMEEIMAVINANFKIRIQGIQEKQIISIETREGSINMYCVRVWWRHS